MKRLLFTIIVFLMSYSLSEALEPGNTVYIEKGSTFRELLTVSDSGTEGNVITYTNYGTGALPIISGADVISGNWSGPDGNGEYTDDSIDTEPLIVVVDGTVWDEGTVTSLAATEWGWTAADGGTLFLGADPAALVVEAGQRDNAIDTNDKNYLTFSGITVEGNNAATGSGFYVDGTNTIIDSCTAQNNYYYAVWFVDGGAGTLSNSTVQYNMVGGVLLASTAGAVTIDSCTIFHNGTVASNEGGTINHSGITSSSTAGTTITDNDISYSGENGDSGHSHGIYLVRDGDVATISGNVIYETYTGHGIACRFDNATINKNRVYNCNDSTSYTGIFINGASSAGTINVNYNLSYNNARGIQIYDTNWHAGTVINIYNNSTYSNDTMEFGVKTADVAGGLNVKNNIFYQTSSARVLYYESDQTALDQDYNCIFTDNTRISEYNSGGWTNKDTFAGWQGSTVGSLDGTQDANSSGADPLFMDASGGDFRLKTGSPCEDAGVATGYDDALDPRDTSFPYDTVNTLLYGSDPEVGAFAYLGALSGVVRDPTGTAITGKVVYVFAYELTGSGDTTQLVLQAYVGNTSSKSTTGGWIMEDIVEDEYLVVFIYYGGHGGQTYIAGAEFMDSIDIGYTP